MIIPTLENCRPSDMKIGDCLQRMIIGQSSLAFCFSAKDAERMIDDSEECEKGEWRSEGCIS